MFNIFGGTPKNSTLTLDPRWLHYGEIVLTGTFAASLNHFKRAFEFVSKNLFQNIGGILLFALFIILFEAKGKDLLWNIVGKHHRIGKQVLVLLALLIILAGLFTLIA